MHKLSGFNNIKVEVVQGIPHNAIYNYYGMNDLDLIALESHGRKYIDRSVTEKVVRKIDAPVFAIGGELKSE
jgi:nucleotide-binding universal stress UspA family protein